MVLLFHALMTLFDAAFCPLDVLHLSRQAMGMLAHRQQIILAFSV